MCDSEHKNAWTIMHITVQMFGGGKIFLGE